jgi:hypothetical protein
MLLYVRQNKMIGGLVMSEKENFLFMASWHDILEGYDSAGKPEMASEIAKQIIYYGVTGKMTSNDPIVTSTVTGMCAAVMDKSKRRYNACVANGKRGGRPKQYDPVEIAALHDSGLSDEQIAEQLGCNVRTVQRALVSAEDEI